MIACVVTAILVGFEVYLWQGGSVDTLKNAVNIGGNGGSTTTKPNTDFNEIKTKEEGIATCEYNRSYAVTIGDVEQKKMGEAMADYCYAVIAGKFNDLSLCQKTIDKNGCRETAQQLIDMGKEIENMSPEDRAKMQDAFKNYYK